jgi:hypothetical protein
VLTEQEIIDAKNFMETQFETLYPFILPNTYYKVEGIIEALDWVLENRKTLMGDDEDED